MNHRAAEIDWNLPKLDQIFLIELHLRRTFILLPATLPTLPRLLGPLTGDRVAPKDLLGTPEANAYLRGRPHPNGRVEERKRGRQRGTATNRGGNGWRGGGKPKHPGKHGPADQEW